jgi:phosphoribosyl-ATP pyrophosphohydrolase
MANLTAGELEVLSRLAAKIAVRRGGDPEVSYTARLVAEPQLAARKVGEEANEVVVAALTETPADLAREAADLVYHLMALLAARGIGLGEVLAELAAREGTSGLAEKAARAKG